MLPEVISSQHHCHSADSLAAASLLSSGHGLLTSAIFHQAATGVKLPQIISILSFLRVFEFISSGGVLIILI